MNRLLATFLCCEITYVASVRVLVRTFTGSLFDLELCWTAFRLVSAVALVLIFRRLARAAPGLSGAIPTHCLWAVGMFLAPILVGNMGIVGPERYLFAATSWVVGLREELAYRGILQGILTPRVGLVGSLAISNLAFVLYHWGVQPFSLHYVLQLVLCGLILGVVYQLSGSLLLVVSLHAVYDAIDAFTPYLDPRMPDYVCTVVLSLTLAVLVLGRKQPTPQSG